MEREVLMRKAVHNIGQLPTIRVQEVNNLIEYLLHKTENDVITEGLQQMSFSGHVYDFLNNEPDIYSVNDLKVKFA